jgi:hypothetical protein
VRPLLNLENKPPYTWLRRSARGPVKLRAQATSRPLDPLPQTLLNFENKQPGGGKGGGRYTERHKPRAQGTLRKARTMWYGCPLNKKGHRWQRTLLSQSNWTACAKHATRSSNVLEIFRYLMRGIWERMGYASRWEGSEGTFQGLLGRGPCGYRATRRRRICAQGES